MLRAVVAGAGGMPYHTQLFFTNIRMPPEYPKQDGPGHRMDLLRVP